MILDICFETAETFKIAGIFIYVLKILVPLAIIIMGVKDVTNVVLKGNVDSVSQSLSSLFRRIIAGILIFLVPTIIPALVKVLIEDYNDSDYKRCNTCLFTPFSGECDGYIKEFKDSQEVLEEDDFYIDGEDLDTSSLGDVPPDYRDDNYKDNGDYSTGRRAQGNGTAEAFLEALDNNSKIVEKQVQEGVDWRYSSGDIAAARVGERSMEDAQNNKNYQCDCASGVLWSLRDAGVLTKDQNFYKTYRDGVNEMGGTFTDSSIQDLFTVIDGNGVSANTLIENGTLQPGDIVLWYNQGHTNAYAGNYLWYDMGRNYTGGYGTHDNYHYKTWGPIRIGYYESAGVWRILRIK